MKLILGQINSKLYKNLILNQLEKNIAISFSY